MRPSGNGFLIRNYRCKLEWRPNYKLGALFSVRFYIPPELLPVICLKIRLKVAFGIEPGIISNTQQGYIRHKQGLAFS